MATEYEIQGNYGHGWECVTTEATLREAREQKRTYDTEEPDYPHRIKRVTTKE